MPLCKTLVVMMTLSLLPAHAKDADLEFRGPYNMGNQGIVRYEDVFHPVAGKKGMVSSQNNLASNVGIEVLQLGGNAIDSAVAMGFALAVTLPRAGNIGGGGFMIVHKAKTGQTLTLDYREMTPSGVTAQHFLTAEGLKDRDSRDSWHSMGVPGTVAGLFRAWQEHGSGKLTWEQVMQPAIKLAKNGFQVNHDLSQLIALKKTWLQENPAMKKALFKRRESLYLPGDVMKRPDLASTLEQIAKHGPDAFYKGEIAKQIVEDMKRNGGHIGYDDLANYKAIEREAVIGHYRGFQVVSMPPPSSGGVAIIQALNILENFQLKKWGHSAKTYHVMAEAMKLTFADRGKHMADPDFHDVPVSWLTDKARAKQLADKICFDKVIASSSLPGTTLPNETPSTTHFSVIDADGNAVSNTYTLSASFGAGKIIKGTGIIMNNQLHTFSVRAGIPGAVGFIASEANKLEPFKRPVSSQSPTIVFKDGKPFLLVGSPGGSRIINVVLQVISNVIDHEMNIAEATFERRIHHQWLPDILEVEPGFNQDSLRLLREIGHEVKETQTMGSSQSIMVVDGYFLGASDPRRPNAKTIGLN